MVLLTINPFLTREPRRKVSRGSLRNMPYTTRADKTDRQTACMHTEYLVMAHGREESVQKAGMSLVTNGGVHGFELPLERAARQDGGAVPFLLL